MHQGPTYELFSKPEPVDRRTNGEKLTISKKIPFMLRVSKHSVSVSGNRLVFVVIGTRPMSVVFLARRFIIGVGS